MTVKSNGALFVNDKKPNPNAPDYRGDFKITQELLDALADSLSRGFDKVQLAGWKKQGQRGPYLSLSVSPPYEKGVQPQPEQGGRAPATSSRTLDDDIPF
jgi:hypothetical protein